MEAPINDLIETSELQELITKKAKNIRIVDAPAFPAGDSRQPGPEYIKEHIPGYLLSC